MNDSRLLLFGWTLLGMATFALLGSLFGGLAGGLSWYHGRAAGSGFAVRIARALARLGEGELSPLAMGALVGAVDGAVFLGLLGGLLGLAAGYTETPPADWVLRGLAIVAAMLGGAIVFGLFAYGLVRLRVRAMLEVFLGGMAGAFAAVSLAGIPHIVPGVVIGMFLGALCGAILRRRW